MTIGGASILMLAISMMPIKYNHTYVPNRSIQYIVIHDTGNTGKGAGVNSHYNYFNGGDRQSSADFFVDDKKIGQFNPDLKNNYCWHVGDGQGRYGSPPITNRNSIGIEICVNSDSNYEQAVSNAVDLTKMLMAQFNIPADRVVRHYDASRKTCPASMSANGWSKWFNFKSRLNAVSSSAMYRVRKSWADAKSQIGAFRDLQNAKNLANQHPDYTVFDDTGKAVYKKS